MPFKLLYESALKLLIPQTPDETYQMIVEEANKLVGAKRGSIFLAKNGVLGRVYSSVPSEHQFEPRKTGYVYQTFHLGKPQVKSAQQIKKERPEVNLGDTKLFIYIPFTFHGETLGVLTLDVDTYEKFSTSQMDMLQIFGSFAILKIRNVQLLSQMQEAIELRDLFISMASHELKTPITTIMGYSHLLERKIAQNKPLNREWVSSLKREAHRLRRIVRELLEVNQIKSGTLFYLFEPTNVKTVLKEAIEDVGFTHPYHHIAIKDFIPENEVKINIDEEKLIQALINVLSNAAKFSDKNHAILVTLEKEEGYVIITVTDKGEGISERDLPRIFEGSYRGKDTKKEGMGLGLFITKNIIEAHQGKISVSSVKGEGTSVKILLPA